MEKFKVIMTGETADLPEPFMLADRSFTCRLTVHAYCLLYVGKNRCVRGGIIRWKCRTVRAGCFFSGPCPEAECLYADCFPVLLYAAVVSLQNSVKILYKLFVTAAVAE